MLKTEIKQAARNAAVKLTNVNVREHRRIACGLRNGPPRSFATSRENDNN
jgi:hypothetical protein